MRKTRTPKSGWAQRLSDIHRRGAQLSLVSQSSPPSIKLEFQTAHHQVPPMWVLQINNRHFLAHLSGAFKFVGGFFKIAQSLHIICSHFARSFGFGLIAQLMRKFQIVSAWARACEVSMITPILVCSLDLASIMAALCRTNGLL